MSPGAAIREGLRDIALAVLAPRATRDVLLLPGATLYGDSIMAGGIADALRAEGFRGVLVDRSIGGDTAQQAFRRMPYERRATSHVVLQLGTNDVSAGRDPVMWLRPMTKRLQAEGRTVVLTGLTERVDREGFEADERIRVLAVELDVECADWGDFNLDLPDGLHPAIYEARRLARALLPLLTQRTGIRT